MGRRRRARRTVPDLGREDEERGGRDGSTCRTFCSTRSSTLIPREDRGDLTGQVFAGFGADRFRTAITRACKTTGMAHFHPHDLRHRRATLWHLWEASRRRRRPGGSATPRRSTCGLYAHVMIDRTELDYSEMLERARTVQTPAIPAAVKTAD